MLEAGLWLQGCLVWQLALIEVTLPIVKFMLCTLKSFPKVNESVPIGSVSFVSDDYQHFYKPFLEDNNVRRMNDTEVSTMPHGTVRWFNTKTGSGFIRTDEGENVLFINGDIRDSDPGSISRGARVSLDVLKSKYGLTGINVRATEMTKGHE
jgi:cold shock CspA family protein